MMNSLNPDLHQKNLSLSPSYEAKENQVKSTFLPFQIKEEETLSFSPLSQKRELLVQKFGEKFFTIDLIRDWKALELYITHSLESNKIKFEDDLTYIYAFIDELSLSDYEIQEAQNLLKTLCVICRHHPTKENIKSLKREQELRNKVNKIACNQEIQKATTDSRRDIFFIEEDGNKLAKVTFYNPKEIMAYHISLLLGNDFIPLITRLAANDARKTYALKQESIVQEFLAGSTIRDFFLTEKNAHKVLKELPDHYIQLYLLQALILGLLDGHYGNTLIIKNEHKGVELKDFDNEDILPKRNYQTQEDHEGRGVGRIALMGTPQAKVQIKPALLILFSSPIIERKLIRYFDTQIKNLELSLKTNKAKLKLENQLDKEVHDSDKTEIDEESTEFIEQERINAVSRRIEKKIENLHATKKCLLERVERIRKFSSLAKRNPHIKLDCRRLYFELFAFEDFIFRNRKEGISDLYAFNSITTSTYPNKVSNSIYNNLRSTLYWENMEPFKTPIQPDEPALDKEQYAGQTAMRKVRAQVKQISSEQTEMIVIELNLNEINLEAWQFEREIDPEILSAFLKGVPAIVARRIIREFPGAKIWIENTQGKYQMKLDPQHKD